MGDNLRDRRCGSMPGSRRHFQTYQRREFRDGAANDTGPGFRDEATSFVTAERRPVDQCGDEKEGRRA